MWSKLDPWVRIAVGGGVLATALVMATMFATSHTTFGILYKLDDPSEAAEIAAALDGAKIEYKTSGGGTIIEVPVEKIESARMLLAGQRLPAGGSVGFSQIYDDPDPATTKETERVNFLRALQGELERTINSLSAVSSSRVHLTLPKATVFRRDQSTPSASIIVDLRGRLLSRTNVAAIQHLVAAGVERLEARDVVVVTTEGERLRGVGETEAEGLDYKTQLQNELETKLLKQLEGLVGVGGVSVSVEAEVDFSKVSTLEETYDPEQISIRSQTTEEAAEGRGAARPQGLAGAMANEPGAKGGGLAAGKGSSNRKAVTTVYEVNKTIVETQSPGANLRKLTVAVVVDGTYTDSEGGGDPVFNPRTAEELAKFQQLVETAVGYSAARGDRIFVTSSQFVARPRTDAAGLSAANDAKPWLPYAIGGGLLLLVGGAFIALRKRGAKAIDAEIIQFPTRVDEAQRALEAAENIQARASLAAAQQLVSEPEMEQLRADVFTATEQDPERAAEVVKAWMNEKDSA